ncbi:MAG TPA: hypothetical protein PK954_11160, partial [Anaerolineales bacterium]|nr:hypothetical protein [Anaerolineales bacterium]
MSTCSTHSLETTLSQARATCRRCVEAIDRHCESDAAVGAHVSVALALSDRHGVEANSNAESVYQAIRLALEQCCEGMTGIAMCQDDYRSITSLHLR